MSDSNETFPNHSAPHATPFVHPTTDLTRIWAARLHVEEPGPHLLEILSPAEWAALKPEDNPEEFRRYNDVCYYRVTRELPDEG